MGWNFGVAIIDGTSFAELAAAGIGPTGQVVSGDEATTSTFEGIAGLERDGSVVIAGSNVEMVDAADRLHAVLGRPTVLAVFSSFSDLYLLEVRGPTGSRTRSYQGGEQTADEGDRLPVETHGPLDEDSLFEIVEALSGFTPDDEFLAGECQVLTWPPIVPGAGARAGSDDGAEPPARRRRWFKR